MGEVNSLNRQSAFALMLGEGKWVILLCLRFLVFASAVGPLIYMKQSGNIDPAIALLISGLVAYFFTMEENREVAASQLSLSELFGVEVSALFGIWGLLRTAA